MTGDSISLALLPFVLLSLTCLKGLFVRTVTVSRVVFDVRSVLRSVAVAFVVCLRDWAVVGLRSLADPVRWCALEDIMARWPRN